MEKEKKGRKGIPTKRRVLRVLLLLYRLLLLIFSIERMLQITKKLHYVKEKVVSAFARSAFFQ